MSVSIHGRYRPEGYMSDWHGRYRPEGYMSDWHGRYRPEGYMSDLITLATPRRAT